MPALAWRHTRFYARHNYLGTGLPFAIKVAFLVLVLPIAFAYLLSLAGIVAIAARAALRNLAALPWHGRGDPTTPTR